MMVTSCNTGLRIMYNILNMETATEVTKAKGGECSSGNIKN